MLDLLNRCLSTHKLIDHWNVDLLDSKGKEIWADLSQSLINLPASRGRLLGLRTPRLNDDPATIRFVLSIWDDSKMEFGSNAYPHLAGHLGRTAPCGFEWAQHPKLLRGLSFKRLGICFCRGFTVLCLLIDGCFYRLLFSASQSSFSSSASSSSSSSLERPLVKKRSGKWNKIRGCLRGHERCRVAKQIVKCNPRTNDGMHTPQIISYGHQPQAGRGDQYGLLGSTK